jgi:hypothetical protein
MKKVLLAVNAEEYDHLCIAMDTHLDYLRANEIEAKYGKDHELEIDMMEKIKYAEHFYEKCKELYWGRGKYKQKENKMKTYEVSLSLNASITVEVTAENELEAEEKAIAKFYNKDLDHVDADHYHYYEMHLLNDHYVTEVEA